MREPAAAEFAAATADPPSVTGWNSTRCAGGIPLRGTHAAEAAVTMAVRAPHAALHTA
ncbi:hypothetical protein KBP30_03930 [Streptomyces sp. Go40/10]|uniref:hypothetical protein n=1 Tax=Streptomyces sp. Go40/10 TaxID=2825844 RepID=UPI001E5B9F70|nr:hypothetical protein [Streptomyces sp. Go40/10]UFR00383.1 hypothetical protein KBP30_03930 [Streptomyces sp. Go40/10]